MAEPYEKTQTAGRTIWWCERLRIAISDKWIAITGSDVSPLVLGAQADDAVRLLEVLDRESGALHARMTLSATVTTMKWSPGGSQLAIGYNDGNLSMYDIGTCRMKLLGRMSTKVNAVEWLNHDGYLLCCDDKTLAVRRVDGGNEMTQRLAANGYQWQDIAVSGRRIAAIETNRVTTRAYTAKLSALETPMVDSWHSFNTVEGDALAIRWQESRSGITLGYRRGIVEEWDTTSGQRVSRVELGGRLYSMDVFNDGTRFVTGEYGAIRSWNHGGGVDRVLKINGGIAWDIALSPRGDVIYVACSDSRLRSYQTGLPVGRIGVSVLIVGMLLAGVVWRLAAVRHAAARP